MAGTAPLPSNQITIQASDLHLNGGQAFGQAQVQGLLVAVYTIAGIVAVVVIIIAGIRYTTANGESAQIQAAKNMMFYGIVGLVVVIMAAAITQFVITTVTK